MSEAPEAAGQRCSFCHDGNEVWRQLVLGPPPIGICDRCVSEGQRIMFDNDDAVPLAAICSFCRKARPDIQALIGSDVDDVHICNACMQLCTEIIAESRGEAAAPLPRAQVRGAPWRRWLRRVF